MRAVMALTILVSAVVCSGCNPSTSPVGSGRSEQTTAIVNESSREEASKLLELISLDYRLDGVEHTRIHDLGVYVPFFQSKVDQVRAVAALSCIWEMQTVVVADAYEAQMTGGLQGFLGLPMVVPQGEELVKSESGSSSMTFRGVTIPESVFGMLEEMKQQGALKAFEQAPFWATPADVGDSGGPQSGFGNFISKTAQYYQANLTSMVMQQILWDEAEKLGRATAKGGNTRAGDVEIQMIWEGPKWGTMLVKNKSKKPIKHVTISMVAPRQENVSASPKFDASMGALGSRVTGEEDPRYIALTAATFADAVAAERGMQEVPIRVYAYIDELGPSQEFERVVFKSGLAFATTKGAYYSLWADGISIENQPLPGYEANIRK